VNETISQLENFDYDNLECIKKVVRKTIDFYKLKSHEEVEKTDLGIIRVLHLHSIAEENLLSKIVEFSLNGDSDLSIEGVYKGHIIRNF
jgi:hypothetical protein